MKLELIGHDHKYVVEQSLLALFPEERPVYGSVDRAADRRYAVITIAEAGDHCTVTTELGWDGSVASFPQAVTLTGDDYAREGQRRRAIGMSFFRAAREATGIAPPWGSLTGIRPAKVAAELLNQGLSVEEAGAVLEDTYFVTPQRRRLCLDAALAAAKADQGRTDRDISLYVGIPFCPTRCAYCSFVSNSVEKSFHLVEPYLAALRSEIASAGQMVRDLGLRVRSFYMGGGTPTTLTAAQMDGLLTCLEESFDFSGLLERTVEAGRPDTITREKLEVLKRHGVDRISVNPQTMEDHVLRAIGRRHTAADIEAAMETVAAVGFPHVNMDLIAGLPEDTPEGFRRSLERVLSFGTDNLTIHTLSLKKGSRITLEGTRIPTVEEVGAMLDYADPLLRTLGFAPYYLYRQKYQSGSFENVGWCRSGGEGLYNIYIMEELHSILSMGAGGSTKMVDRRHSHIERVFNLKFPLEYTQRPEKAAENQRAFAAFHRAMLQDLQER